MTKKIPLTYGSLFSGIGGFDLGLDRAGMTCKFQIEIDPFCQKILNRHWPSVRKITDIKNASNLDKVDVLCGGFPCQDISIAGKQLGLSGERSGLWKEFKRIINEVKPKYIIIENVAQLKNNGLVEILQDLHESGYDAEWDIIPASAYGGWHSRKRIWIVAYPSSKRVPGFSKTRCFDKMRQRRQSGKTNMFDRKEKWQDIAFNSSSDSALISGKNDGFPNWAHRVKSLGNAVVPYIVEDIGKAIIEFEK